MNDIGLQRLCGRIGNLKESTTTIDVFVTTADRAALKATAGATALAGSADLGIGLLALDADSRSEADLLQFDLEQPNGSFLKVEARVWWSPFENGDEVEVVAEQVGEVWKGVAVARPSDRLVAVYPLCTHGRWAHWKKVAKWWFWITFGLLLAFFSLVYFMTSISTSVLINIFFYTAVAGGALFAIIACLVGRKVGRLVPLSEEIFRTFGWKNPNSFDLYSTTKAKRRPDDPEPLGVSYFRC